MSISGEDPLERMGRIDYGGIIKEASLAYVPEAVIGDYVIVHVGFAISKVDEEEANKVFEYLRQMNELIELEESGESLPSGPPGGDRRSESGSGQNPSARSSPPSGL